MDERTLKIKERLAELGAAKDDKGNYCRQHTALHTLHSYAESDIRFLLAENERLRVVVPPQEVSAETDDERGTGFDN